MKEVLKLVNLVIKKSYDVSFSKLLGIKDLKIISTNKTTAAFSYKIDESLCVLSPETPRLSTAATLAVFDELSTMGLMIFDRKCRPGVSISLTTETLDKCVPGQDVIVSTTCDKVGKTVGFCSMEMRHKDTNALLARGRHIKFLPMGFLYELLTAPLFLPFLVWILDKFGEKLLVTKPISNSVVENEIKGFGKVFESFQAKKLDEDSHLRTLNAQQKREELYLIHGKSYHNNLLGKMHGGAIAASIERANYLNRSDIDCYINKMDVTYLSSAKGDVLVGVYEDEFVKDCTKGKVYSERDGSVCAEYTCFWSR